MNGPAISSGMGTCGLVGQIGVITGWMGDGGLGSIGAMNWLGLILISFVLPAIVTYVIHKFFLQAKLYTDEDLKLNV